MSPLYFHFAFLYESLNEFLYILYLPNNGILKLLLFFEDKEWGILMSTKGRRCSSEFSLLDFLIVLKSQLVFPFGLVLCIKSWKTWLFLNLSKLKCLKIWNYTFIRVDLFAFFIFFVINFFWIHNVSFSIRFCRIKIYNLIK